MLVRGKSRTPLLFASTSVLSTVFSLASVLFFINTTRSTPTLLFQKRKTFRERKPSSVINTAVTCVLTLDARAWNSGVYEYS